MDYRFEISKPDSNDFRCEIAINGEQTFQQLHDKLVETLNFDGLLVYIFLPAPLSKLFLFLKTLH